MEGTVVPMAKALRKWLGGVGRRSAPAYPASVEIDGRDVPLAVREHPTARRMVMRVSPCGGILKVTVPKRTGSQALLSFLDRHRGWAQERLSAAASLVVGDGALLPFRGENILLRHHGGRQTRLMTDEERALLLVGGAPEHFSRRVRDFLMREARGDLQAAVERHAATIGIRPAALSLKDTRSRWGSCTADRKLAFSWRIVMAPPQVLDYLAAHEVAHLKEMNHGPAFWALCRELCPAMDEGRDWLKRHGAGLHGVRFP